MKFIKSMTTYLTGLKEQAQSDNEDFYEDPVTLTQPEPEQRAVNNHLGLDTVIIIDHSGSMADCDFKPDRLQGGKEAAIEYVRERIKISPYDRVAVIAFDHRADIRINLTDITLQQLIVDAINGIEIEGGTNITKGLKAAVEIFSDQELSANARQIILLTDGHGGHPLRTATKLKERLQCTIDVVGIGGEPEAVNEELLRQVATTELSGVNHYRFITDSRSLKEHYKEIATQIMWNPQK